MYELNCNEIYEYSRNVSDEPVQYMSC